MSTVSDFAAKIRSTTGCQQREAIEEFIQSGENNTSVIDTLLDVAGSTPDFETRWLAVKAVTAAPGIQASAIELAWLMAEYGESWFEAKEAAQNMTAGEAREAVNALVWSMGDAPTEMCRPQLNKIISMGAVQPSVIPPLQFLLITDPPLRKQIVCAVGRLAQYQPGVVFGGLVKLFAYPDQDVRLAAVGVLTSTNNAPAEVIEPVLDLFLKEPDEFGSPPSEALWQLAQNHPVAVLRALRPHVTAKGGVGRYAASALVGARSVSPQLVAAVGGLLADRSARVRELAVWFLYDCLSRSGVTAYPAKLRGPLARMRSDPSPRVREVVQETLTLAAHRLSR